MLKSGISKLLTSTVDNTEISGKEIAYDDSKSDFTSEKICSRH